MSLTGGLKIGSFFQGRRIIRRMDSGRKPFREVYLCSSNKATEQVLILYKNNLIPACMIEIGTICPIEYYRRIHLHGDDTNGLPELYDYGQNEIYTWLFEESLIHMSTLGALNGILNLTPPVKRCMIDFITEVIIHVSRFTPLLDTESPMILNPDNIRWKSENAGLSTAITSLDELFAPEYYDIEAVYPYYAIRNEAQMLDRHKKLSIYYPTWSSVCKTMRRSVI